MFRTFESETSEDRFDLKRHQSLFSWLMIIYQFSQHAHIPALKNPLKKSNDVLHNLKVCLKAHR